ncbi:hypothetical protein EYF80_015640 [Liparis tanakae]|uniref:Uncharacterized protein n=1 Tax=Liparis tanakae TaxID=230148 RepID=A0A4Z2I9X1_9TELE|nr:hypothetical protein EYF80_015640 [Liparis tanakae]
MVGHNNSKTGYNSKSFLLWRCPHREEEVRSLRLQKRQGSIYTLPLYPLQTGRPMGFLLTPASSDPPGHIQSH